MSIVDDISEFKLFGKEYGFTRLGDKHIRYSYNTTKTYLNGVLQPKPDEVHYHRMGLGLYYKSNSCLV